MKKKILVLAIALSLLFSIMLIAAGGEARNAEYVSEKIEEDAVITQLADSPWPSFGRGRNNSARSPYDTSHVDGTMRWSFETGSDVVSSPAIGEDDTIYVGSNDGYLYAINPNGTEEWSVHLDGGEVESSPVIGEDGMIYVGLSYHVDDECLIAVDSETGEIEWRADTGSGVISSPVIGEDGTIYVASTDNGILWAFDSDGDEEWSYDGATERVESSPAIADDGTIYFGSWDGNLYAVDSDGEEEWVFESDEDEVRIDSSPAVGDDGTIYVGQGFLEGDGLYAIDPDNGEEEWRFEPGAAVESSPAIAEDGTIYVGAGDDNLYAIDQNGEEEWSFEVDDSVTSSPAIGADGTIYVGDSHDEDGGLYAVNPDGTEKWNFETGDRVRSSPAIGQDGTIYFGSHDNNLYAITGEHDLTIGIEGNGETDPSEGTHTYLHGEDVTVIATPDEGWYFAEWTGDVPEGEEGEEITITMDEDKDITAVFEEYATLTIQDITGQGTVYVDGSEVSAGFSQDYEQGTEVELEADPDFGWYFADWEGIPEDEAEITLTMEEDVTITNALFEEYVVLTVFSTEGGSIIQPEQEITEHEQGAVVNLVAEADPDYHFVEWTGDVNTIEEVTSSETTITMNEDYVIEAEFEVTQVEQVNIYPEEDQQVEAGEEREFTAEAIDQEGEIVTDDVTDFDWENIEYLDEEENVAVFYEETVGGYEVTAEYDGVTSDPTEVTVGPSDVDHVEINPADDQTIIAGEDIDFTATAYDEWENTVEDDDEEFTWQNTDGTGLFEITTAGEYEVTATYDDVISEPTTVTVEEDEVDSLEIVESPVSITAGDSFTLTIEGADQYGNTAEGQELDDLSVVSEFDGLVYSEDSIELDDDGRYEAVVPEDQVTTAHDEHTISVDSTGIEGDSVDILVEIAEIEYIEILPNEYQIVVYTGEEFNFTAAASDEYGNTVEEITEFEWTNTNEYGLFLEDTADHFMVNATYEGFTSNTVRVTVVTDLTESDIEDLQEQIDDLDDRISDLEDMELQNQIDDLQNQIDNITDEDIPGIESELEELENKVSELEEEQDDQDDDIAMARNLGIVGLILAILAIIIAIVAMQKKKPTEEEEPMYDEEEKPMEEEQTMEEEYGQEDMGEEEMFEEPEESE